VTEYIPTVTFS